MRSPILYIFCIVMVITPFIYILNSGFDAFSSEYKNGLNSNGNSLSYGIEPQVYKNVWKPISRRHELYTPGTSLYFAEKFVPEDKTEYENTEDTTTNRILNDYEDIDGGLESFIREINYTRKNITVPRLIHLIFSGDGTIEHDGSIRKYIPQEDIFLDCLLESLLHHHIEDPGVYPHMFIMLSFRYGGSFVDLFKHFSYNIQQILLKHREYIIFNFIHSDVSLIDHMAVDNSQFSYLKIHFDTKHLEGDGSIVSDIYRLIVLKLYAGIYTDSDRLWHAHVMSYQDLYPEDKKINILGQQGYLTDFTYGEDIMTAVVEGNQPEISGLLDDMCGSFVFKKPQKNKMLKHINNDLIFMTAVPKGEYIYNSRCTKGKDITVDIDETCKFTNPMDMFPEYIQAINDTDMFKESISSKNFRIFGPLFITHWIKYLASPYIIIPDIWYNTFSWKAFRKPPSLVTKVNPTLRKLLDKRIAVHYARVARLIAYEWGYEEDSMIGITVREDCPRTADDLMVKGIGRNWVYNWIQKSHPNMKKGRR